MRRVVWVDGKAPELIPVLRIDAFIGFYSFFLLIVFQLVELLQLFVGNFCVFAEQDLKIQMFLKLSLLCYNLFHLDFFCSDRF